MKKIRNPCNLISTLTLSFIPDFPIFLKACTLLFGVSNPCATVHAFRKWKKMGMATQLDLLEEDQLCFRRLLLSFLFRNYLCLTLMHSHSQGKVLTLPFFFFFFKKKLIFPAVCSYFGLIILFLTVQMCHKISRSIRMTRISSRFLFPKVSQSFP